MGYIYIDYMIGNQVRVDAMLRFTCETILQGNQVSYCWLSANKC